MADLFGEGEIRWERCGMKGRTSDGYAVEIRQSELSARFIASITAPGGILHRRSHALMQDAKDAAESVIAEARVCILSRSRQHA